MEKSAKISGKESMGRSTKPESKFPFRAGKPESSLWVKKSWWC